MEKKEIQYIWWSIEKDKTTITSQIFSNIEDLIKLDIDDNVAIAIGLNPSNTTIFNEDETNMYLRAKLCESKCNGYILLNLVSKIESDSKKISALDLEVENINNIISIFTASII
jgi:hypothetical protein